MHIWQFLRSLSDLIHWSTTELLNVNYWDAVQLLKLLRVDELREYLTMEISMVKVTCWRLLHRVEVGIILKIPRTM